jgi:hypothetical protein
MFSSDANKDSWSGWGWNFLG